MSSLGGRLRDFTQTILGPNYYYYYYYYYYDNNNHRTSRKGPLKMSSLGGRLRDFTQTILGPNFASVAYSNCRGIPFLIFCIVPHSVKVISFKTERVQCMSIVSLNS